MRRQGCANDAGRDRRAASFAQAHAQRQQRIELQPGEQTGMTGLGRDMAGDAMIRDRGIVGGQRGERGAADEAVQHHRHAELARAQHRAGDGRDLAPADMAQRLEGESGASR